MNKSWSCRSWSCEKLINPYIQHKCSLWAIKSIQKGAGGVEKCEESRLGYCMTTVMPQETGRSKLFSLTFWVVHCWLHTQHDLYAVCTMSCCADKMKCCVQNLRLDLVPRLRAWNQAMPIVSNPTHFWNEAEVLHISNPACLKSWRLCGSSVSSSTIIWVTWNKYF